MPAREAGDTTALIQRAVGAVGALGGVNVALFGSLIAVTAVISKAPGRSTRLG